MLNKHNTLNYCEAAHTDAATKVAEDTVAYALPPQVDVQQNTIEAIMLMYSTLTEKSRHTVSARIIQYQQDDAVDRELASKLSDLPSWDEVEHPDTSTLTKADYQYAIRHSRRHAMKGIEKWL